MARKSVDHRTGCRIIVEDSLTGSEITTNSPLKSQKDSLKAAGPAPTINKASPVLRSSFTSIIKLATQLIDPDWDSAILN